VIQISYELVSIPLIFVHNLITHCYVLQGSLIYVNYGRNEDFKLLVSMGIQFSDSICIARYAKIFRGNKVGVC